ncbi:peptidase C39 [Pedobacter psychrodurus]|uniref:Peptidase C39 n=1 Tax=Pedobacter psychrodurus TaxID=2530456 RepID=A0A4R0Q176_9SPHI|nr:thioredoxin domain-containing protein [Pedobacter psychrodurus]TCD27795.1 peptidase C39 [Pedobacter psychrodurus]
MNVLSAIFNGGLSFYKLKNVFGGLKNWKLFRSQDENADLTLKALIKKLNIKVTSETSEECLANHPEYPSLLALSDCLTSWKVPHQSYKIDQENLNTEELSYPFIAHFPEGAGRFILVEDIVGNIVKYSGEAGINKVLTKEDFLSQWSGILLYAQKVEGSGESSYRESLFRSLLNSFRLPFLVVASLAAVVLKMDFNNVNAVYLSLLALKLMGVIVSILLIMYSINANNPFIQNLCSLGKKNECNAILKSDAAKVTSWLSWSEVGMFYFVGSFICLLFNPSSIILLKWLNIACLPYTFYSISYQFKRKNWCLLCCTVQALLWFEGFVFVLNYSWSWQLLSTNNILSTIFSFLFPIAIWSALKPLLMKSEQTESLKKQLKKFKYNSDLFSQLLTSQHRYTISDDITPINLGNREASTVITMVSNPFCGPCAKAHRTINEWLQNREDLQLRVIFSTGNNDRDERTKVARHIGALSSLNDGKIMENALDDWYFNSKGKYDIWAKKYPISFNGEMNVLTAKQKHWCEMAEITFTPTIFINGYKLPEPYRLEDIEYLLS